ncbi:hypothetical protein, partial [Escherichia coli]|uniref:hypothetical protein n=1 Tax=Escherichia coli TaxID=562 RepID=UPI0019D68B87
MGGVCISVAMEMFPEKIAVAVFVTAFMRVPDLSFVTLLQEWRNRPSLESHWDSKIMFDEGLNDHPNGSVIFEPSNSYQLSPLEDLTLA